MKYFFLYYGLLDHVSTCRELRAKAQEHDEVEDPKELSEALPEDAESVNLFNLKMTGIYNSLTENYSITTK